MFECDNEIVQSELNPKGPQVTVVFIRDCGAITSSSTHVSVLSQAEVSDSEAGNALVASGGTPESPGVKVEWKNVRELTVHLSAGMKIKTSVAQVGTIRVSAIRE